MSDWVYFPYNGKRATSDVLEFIGNKNDFLSLLPGYLQTYWPLIFIALFFFLGLRFSYNKIELYFKRKEAIRRLIKKETTPQPKLSLYRFAFMLVGIAILILGIRGGFRYTPINLSTASRMTSPENAPLILNTTFSMIKTYNKTELEFKHYMPREEAFQYINPIKNFNEPGKSFRKENVVVLILESFSKEFTGVVRGSKTFTPFLDSIANEGLSFTRAYANGVHSADGIPAIVAGLPTLFDEYYTYSRYSNNQLTTIANLLTEKGYETAFFHGGTNGTFHFNNFAFGAGYQRYYGRTEYGNEKDYDGNWGIYDWPFLQFSAKKINELKEPFLATIFTLSSHPPYKLPKNYRAPKSNSNLKIEPTIRYTDQSLREFFATARTKPWYNHTLFILVPDHCSPLGENDYYREGHGHYQIPLIFFDPGNQKLSGKNDLLTQQIDILPTVMDYLHYPDTFYALGNSALRGNTTRFVINKYYDIYDWIYGDYQLFIQNDWVRKSFRYPADTLFSQNLVKKGFTWPRANQKTFQAFVQIYNEAMIKNELSLKTFQKEPIKQK